jgi:hypothetical protein
MGGARLTCDDVKLMMEERLLSRPGIWGRWIQSPHGGVAQMVRATDS